MQIAKIIGLKVLAIKGDSLIKKYHVNENIVEPRYILFDDNETLIELDEQDPYTFHDADSSARNLRIFSDKRFWKAIMENDKAYPMANCDV
jgi:hypothetical protein